MQTWATAYNLIIIMQQHLRKEEFIWSEADCTSAITKDWSRPSTARTRHYPSKLPRYNTNSLTASQAPLHPKGHPHPPLPYLLNLAPWHVSRHLPDQQFTLPLTMGTVATANRLPTPHHIAHLYLYSTSSQLC